MSPPTHFVPALGAHLYQTAYCCDYILEGKFKITFSEARWLTIAVWLLCSSCIIESGQIIKLYLDVGLTRSTHKVTIDTVEDMHGGRHLIKTHLNPKIRKEKLFFQITGHWEEKLSDHQIFRGKTFRSPDIRVLCWSWPPGPFASSSLTASRLTSRLGSAPSCQGSTLEQLCGCHPWTLNFKSYPMKWLNPCCE